MRILVFIFIIIASVGLQSCNSTVKSVYRDDFRSASKTEVKNIQEEVGATSSSKSILILTQTYKGEKIIISQNGKIIFSEYPITNLKSRIANYLSVNRNFDVHIKDISTKKEVVIPSKKIAKQIGKDAVHMAKYSSLAISGVLIYGPSVVDALRGRISMNQLMKNAGVGTTGVIGGAIGSVMGPAGAITGGIIGSAIGKKIMDVMVEDDAVEVYEIIREEFIDGVLTAGLSQKEFDNMIELTFANKKFSKMMKEVYHAGNNFIGMEQIDAQRKYARDNIIDLNIIKLYKMRNSIDENNIIEAIEIFDENLGDNTASFAFDM